MLKADTKAIAAHLQGGAAQQKFTAGRAVRVELVERPLLLQTSITADHHGGMPNNVGNHATEELMQNVVAKLVTPMLILAKKFLHQILETVTTAGFRGKMPTINVHNLAMKAPTENVQQGKNVGQMPLLAQLCLHHQLCCSVAALNLIHK